jgi:hypothetical protein
VDSFRVRLQIAVLVDLEAHATVGELVDRAIDVVDREVQARKRRGAVVRLS